MSKLLESVIWCSLEQLPSYRCSVPTTLAGVLVLRWKKAIQQFIISLLQQHNFFHQIVKPWIVISEIDFCLNLFIVIGHDLDFQNSLIWISLVWRQLFTKILCPKKHGKFYCNQFVFGLTHSEFSSRIHKNFVLLCIASIQSFGLVQFIKMTKDSDN